MRPTLCNRRVLSLADLIKIDPDEVFLNVCVHEDVRVRDLMGSIMVWEAQVGSCREQETGADTAA